VTSYGNALIVTDLIIPLKKLCLKNMKNFFYDVSLFVKQIITYKKYVVRYSDLDGYPTDI